MPPPLPAPHPFVASNPFSSTKTYHYGGGAGLADDAVIRVKLEDGGFRQRCDAGFETSAGASAGAKREPLAGGQPIVAPEDEMPLDGSGGVRLLGRRHLPVASHEGAQAQAHAVHGRGARVLDCENEGAPETSAWRELLAVIASPGQVPWAVEATTAARRTNARRRAMMGGVQQGLASCLSSCVCDGGLFGRCERGKGSGSNKKIAPSRL